MLNEHLLFFFSALGAFNGLALALYLWLAAAQSQAQRALALLVLLVSVRTGKSVLFYFLAETPALVMQAGITACLLIGPAAYWYTRASLAGCANSSDSVSLSGGAIVSDKGSLSDCTSSSGGVRAAWPERLHAIVLLLAVTVVNLGWPYAQYAELWHQLIISAANTFWCVYLLVSTGLLWLQRDRLPTGRARQLLLAVNLALWLIWLAYFTSGFTSYIVGALSFSFLLYVGVVVVWAKRQGETAVVPYQNRRIPPEEAALQLQALTDLMNRERLYLDPALTLVRVARKLGLPQARLSQLLNDNNGTTFKQYIAQLRVDETQRLLLEQPDQTLEAIAEAAGFQSLSTFYAAFKKANGCTPALYRQRFLSQ